jgi:hypothetical protein
MFSRLKAAALQTWKEWKIYLKKLQLDYKKVLLRWRFTALWTAWSTWSAGINHSQSVRNVGRQALHHMMHTTTAKSFDAWARNTADQKRVVKSCQRILLRWYMKQLALALDGWFERVMQIQMLRDTANKVVQRLMNRALVEGFERWQDQTAEEKQMKAKALKVVRRLMNRLLVEGFDAWRMGAMEQKRVLNSCKRAIARVLRGSLASAFQGWHEKAFMAVKFLLRWCNRGLSRAFATWRLGLTQEKHSAATLGAFLYVYVLSLPETGGKQ